MRIENQPAFVLHARNWRETSLLVEVLSLDHGRIGLVARGVHGPKKHLLRAALQPLQHIRLAAVQRGDNGGGSLWVVDDAGQVRQRPVKLGAFGEDSLPVLSGLRANEWVVAGGGHLLREGEQVNPVDRRNRPVGAAAAAAAPVAKQAR